MENETSDVPPKCQGPLQLLSPPFLMTSTTNQMRPNGRGGFGYVKLLGVFCMYTYTHTQGGVCVCILHVCGCIYMSDLDQILRVVKFWPRTHRLGYERDLPRGRTPTNQIFDTRITSRTIRLRTTKFGSVTRPQRVKLVGSLSHCRVYALIECSSSTLLFVVLFSLCSSFDSVDWVTGRVSGV